MKLITKVFTLCSKPEKLCEPVFHSLSSCSFTFTFSLSELHIVVYFLTRFWLPLWPGALDSHLVCLNILAAPRAYARGLG